MKAFITRIRFSRNRWICLLAGLIWCAAAEAQQTQCYAVTSGQIISGNGARWSGRSHPRPRSDSRWPKALQVIPCGT